MMKNWGKIQTLTIPWIEKTKPRSTCNLRPNHWSKQREKYPTKSVSAQALVHYYPTLKKKSEKKDLFKIKMSYCKEKVLTTYQVLLNI